MSADHFVTVGELAAELRISEDTLFFWRSKNKGPRSTKFGRRVVFKRSDVDAWITAQEQATAKGGAA